ncbi:MAG: hypothetical protein U9Q07_14225, partial [Planctomycetota bacterium]|nr:hypothetical protein [Planctomycetota bacterium]
VILSWLHDAKRPIGPYSVLLYPPSRACKDPFCEEIPVKSHLLKHQAPADLGGVFVDGIKAADQKAGQDRAESVWLIPPAASPAGSGFRSWTGSFVDWAKRNPAVGAGFWGDGMRLLSGPFQHVAGAASAGIGSIIAVPPLTCHSRKCHRQRRAR